MINIVLTFLLGNIYWGMKGRFLLGLAIFDFLVLFMIIYIFLKRKTINKNFFILFYLLFFGLLSTFINFYGDFYDKYSFIITELRFYVYIPLMYIIAKNTDYKKIHHMKFYIISFTLMYILIYMFFLDKGSFIYNTFNNVEVTTNLAIDKFRLAGPSIIFLTMFIILYLDSLKKTNIPYIELILYAILIIIVFIKTGSRQQFVISLMPYIYILLKSKKIHTKVLMISLFIFTIFITPLFIEEAALVNRFYNIANPLNDSSFVYRLLNNQLMINQILEKNIFIFMGHGLGSNYEVYLAGLQRSSYFLDNSFLTMIYKFGFIITLAFIIYLLFLAKKSDRTLSILFLSLLFITGFLSYHLITNPIYFLLYFMMIFYSKEKLK